MRLLSIVSLLMISTAAFGGKLDALPEVDPEQFQPGIEVPVAPRQAPDRRMSPRPQPVPQAIPVPQPVVVAPPPNSELGRFNQLYRGYRGPTPVYTPYYTPPRYYGGYPPPPPAYYGPPPVDPGMVILGIIANQVIPAIIYNATRRRY